MEEVGFGRGNMKTRIIFVEGIPGAGKTTAVQQIGNICKEKGVVAHTYLEGHLDQPADYERVSYLQEENLSIILDKHSISPLLLNGFKETVENGVLIYYGKQEESRLFPEEFIKELSFYDVYNQSPTIYTTLIKRKWASFKKSLGHNDNVYILDCCLLQNPTTFLMAKNNLSNNFIQSFVKELINEIREFQPMVIYIEPADITQSFSHVQKERSTDWFEFVRDYYTTQEFGNSHGLSNDLNGVIQYLIHRIELEKEILSHSKIDWVHIQRSQSSFGQVNKMIEEEIFLRL